MLGEPESPYPSRSPLIERERERRGTPLIEEKRKGEEEGKKDRRACERRR